MRSKTWYEQAVPDTMHTIEEAAEIANYTPLMIKRWIRQGRVRAYGEPGQIQVRLREVLPPYLPKKRKRA